MEILLCQPSPIISTQYYWVEIIILIRPQQSLLLPGNTRDC